MEHRTLLRTILLCAIGTLLLAPASAQLRKLTAAELSGIKLKEGVFIEGKNYNIQIKGFGTGLRPPTQEQWDLIGEKADVRDYYKSALAVPSSFDNSSLPWFPPIGNQASEGSCVAWAAGYYTKTFQEAAEHKWDLSAATWTSGAPTPMYQDRIFSPDFIYHQVNGGKDEGAYYYDALQLLENVGCCTWTNMPYSYYDHTSWPEPAAWREAPLYRSTSGYAYMYANTDAALESLKQMLADTNLVIISMDANQYSNLSDQDLWTADDYVDPKTNHANTIVGYDDDYGPYMEEGESRYGAFKVANSWGTGNWENINDGFYYLSYECMKQRIEYIMYFENLLNYEPRMLAVFNIAHPSRDACNISFGIGETDSPFEKKYLNDGQYMGGGEHPFPLNDMALDITEFLPHFSGESDTIFEDVYDAGFTAGSLNSFSLEIYSDYKSGVPTAVYTASGLPLSTQYNSHVYAFVHAADPEPKITVSPTSLSARAAPDSIRFRNLELTNSGTGTLHFSISTESETPDGAGNGPEWLSCSPLSDSIPIGSSSLIETRFDASGLSEGSYQAMIKISSNDSADSLVIVPLTLFVEIDADSVFISLSADPVEGGTVEGAGKFLIGNDVLITATPDTTYEFVNWTEGDAKVSRKADYTFTAEDHRSLVANFNRPPLANAGTDQTVNAGEKAELDGTLSSDPDNDVISYRWSAPPQIILSDARTATPSFNVPMNASGKYVFMLIVNDSIKDSEADTIVVNVNHKPHADAGPDQSADPGASIVLDGSASSDPDGDTLTYLWSAPAEITLSDATSALPAFDVPQSAVTGYEFTLLVNDGMMDSELDTVLISINILGTDFISWSEKINIYPNPASGILHIEMPGYSDCEYTITLTDISGRNLTTRKYNGNSRAHIDVSDYPAGVYTISINRGDFKRTEKIIVK